MKVEKELERLEREIAGSSSQASPTQRGLLLPAAKEAKPRNRFDLVLALAAVLVITGVGVNSIRQMPDEYAKSLRDGLIGSAVGLFAGYAIGRFRP